MKKDHWHLLLEPDMKAPVSGIYLFAIRDDNHISYECRKLNEGESFYCAVGTLSTDPTAWFVPIAYHFCKEFVFSNGFSESSCVTDNSWYPCNCDHDTYGLRVLAFTLNGVLKYDVIREDCFSFERDVFLKFSEGYLYSIPVYCDDERDDQQDIKLLAYHYVEDFGEEGHIYWWNEYRKNSSEIEW